MILPLIGLLLSSVTANAGTVSVEIRRGPAKSINNRGNKLSLQGFEKALNKQIFDEAGNSLLKANDVVPEALLNKFYAYYATLYIGSNKDPVAPAIDTGSSDLWVMESTNPYCKLASFNNCTNQTFDATHSTTLVNTTIPWRIGYLDGTGANGTLVRDSVSFGGKNVVTNSTFAVATSSSSDAAIFGIGFDSNEALAQYNSNGTNVGYIYQNVPSLMKSEGLISKVAYSIYLNDVTAQTGQVLFGGVDHSQYTGSLALVQMVNIYTIDKFVDLRVLLNGISVKSVENNTETTCALAEFNVPVLLDSGTSYALLPHSVTDAIGSRFGFNNGTLVSGFWTGDCDVPFDFTFELDFSGKIISVPANSLLDVVTDDNGKYKINGKTQCLLGIQSTSRPQNYIVGDIFMRSMYVTFDLDSKVVAIAQAKYDSAAPEIEAIVDSIPRAVKAPRYNNTHYKLYETKINESCARYRAPANTSTARSSTSSTRSSTARSSATSVLSSTALYSANSTHSSSAHYSGNSTHSSTLNSSGNSPKTSELTSASAESTAALPAATSKLSTLVTTIPTPTTLTALGQTLTVSESTVLTITDCGCTETSVKPKNTLTESKATSSGTTLITTIPTPTTLTALGQTLTVSESTVLTITDCGCTNLKSSALSGSSVETGSPASSPALIPVPLTSQASEVERPIESSATNPSISAIPATGVPQASQSGSATEVGPSASAAAVTPSSASVQGAHSSTPPTLANLASRASIPASIFLGAAIALLV